MSFDFKSLLRPHIAELAPYSSARDEYTGTEGIFLDANENPYGSATPRDYNRYPDPYQAQIKAKLAPIKGVRTEQIFLGNGSDEPIDLLIRAMCTPGKDNVIIMPPTYGMYEVSASINDVPLIKVPLTKEYQLHVEEVLAAITPETKIIWICSPNNPTGNLIERSAIQTILESFNGVVVVDEAYIDFASEPSWLTALDQYPNLLVLQTFSKAWGLASLRAGMAFASAEIIRILNKIKPPYNMGGPAQELLLEALEHEDRTKAFVTDILVEREALIAGLQQLPTVVKIHPTDANFVLVEFTNASGIMHYLIDNQIIVRDRSKVTLCDGCLRITVGTRAENQALLERLAQFQSGN